MRSRLPSVLAFLLLALLLPVGVQAATRVEMAWKEKLESHPQQTWPVIQPPKGKYEYLLTAWRKDDRWGVISEEQLQDPSRDRSAVPKAHWLAKPLYDGVMLPKFKRTQGHFWLKPTGDTRWHVFHTNGKKLTALGATPYSEVHLLRGSDSMSLAELQVQLAEYPQLAAQYTPAIRTDLVLGVHAGGDPASATADLIDAGENRVLLTLNHLDLRQPPLLSRNLLLLRHDATSNAHTVLRLPPPPAPDASHAALDVSDVFRDLTLKGPVASALDDDGHAVLLDRDLRPFNVPGLSLGRPEPPLVLRSETDIFYKVLVLTDDGRAGYQFISRNKDGNPVLAPTLWKNIQFMRLYLIAQDMDDQWHLLRWTRHADGYQFTPRQLDGKPVVTATLDAMDLAITEVHRLDMQQLAASNRQMAEQQARWEAERAARQRREAEERAELQRQIKEYEKARRETELENHRRNQEAAAAFASRNKSGWTLGQPITLPSLQGAPSLSTMEKDYYDNRGNARNPYVVRERK